MDAFSIPLKCWRNQAFIVPFTLFYDNQQGPVNLLGFNLEMLIGQPSVPQVVAPTGAPMWYDTPGGLPALYARDVAPYTIATSRYQWKTPWGETPWQDVFGAAVLSVQSPTTNFEQGNAVFTFTGAQTAALLAATPYRWMILLRATGDPSPVIGGPLTVLDAPAFV
jgi:hypothetical protein